MIYDNKSFFNWKGCVRLFLDLPYRYGVRHLKLIFSKNKEIIGIAKQLQIESKPRKLTKKEKAFHLIIGIVECTPLIGIIVAFVDRYFHQGDMDLDKHRLIRGRQNFEFHQHAWHLNLALLKSAYDGAKGKQKRQIKFLAANFLNKVTPKHLNLWTNDLKKIDSHYLTTQQGSPIEEFRYHRECLEQKLTFGKKFNQNLAYGEKSLFILTDTDEVDHLFPLHFTVIDNEESIESYAAVIKKVLHDHFSKNPNEALDRPLNLPFLIDVTHILDKNIQTNKEENAEKEFINCFEEFKEKIRAAENMAIEQLIHDNPNFLEFKSKIKKHLDDNTTCISRVKMKGAAGIKMLPIGSSSSQETQFKSPLINYIVNTGIYIGAVHLRRLISDVFQQRPDISYGVSKGGKSTLYYPQKEDFTEGPLFQRLLCLFGSKGAPSNFSCGIAPDQLSQRIDSVAEKPHIAMLGKATMDLLQGLMNEIDGAKWNELNGDPILSQIFQTSLFLIRERLATAEQYAIANKFNEFAQEIELIHAELAGILELTHPFNEEDFGKIYKKELLGQSAPDELENELRVGLGKTAVNVFTGIAAAAKKQNVPLQGVFSAGSYFEQTILTKHHFDHFISDPSLPKLDLYLGQFNANVDSGSTLTEYKRRDVAADVRKLLEDNRVTENFTVAVDITIDEFYSTNVKQLLMEFQEEIKSGNVNFAFFASGQKFYTLGMDNYYGSPFYMVNNGEKKWKAFDSLLNHPAYRTDNLSVQWFCLATKYASDSLSNYRKLIFNNTRHILDRMPASLQPNNIPNQKYKVNKAHADMDPCFIDMKALGSAHEQWERSEDVRKIFYQMMIKEGMECYFRGSFGFYHCNFAIFGPLDPNARTIRLNPGINPDENEKIIEFFNTVSAKL